MGKGWGTRSRWGRAAGRLDGFGPVTLPLWPSLTWVHTDVWSPFRQVASHSRAFGLRDLVGPRPWCGELSEAPHRRVGALVCAGPQVSSAAGFCPARRSRRPPCLADPSPDLGDLSAVVKRGLPHPECRGPSADSTPRYCGTFGSQLGYSCGCEGSQAVAPPWTVLGSVR